MELFPTIENVVRFDATSDFLERSCSFGLLFAELGFGSIINMIKISNQIGDKRYVSNAQMGHFTLGTSWYASSIQGFGFIKVLMTTFL